MDMRRGIKLAKGCWNGVMSQNLARENGQARHECMQYGEKQGRMDIGKSLCLLSNVGFAYASHMLYS